MWSTGRYTPPVLEEQGGGVGCGGGPAFELVRDGAGSRRCRRAVEAVEQPAPLLLGLEVEGGDGRVRVGRDPGEHPAEPVRDALGDRRLEVVLLVLHDDVQPVVGGGRDTERVVGAVAGADTGDRDAAVGVGVGEAVPLHREGLEDHDGVEQRGQSGGPADLGEPDVMVVHQRALPVLERGEHLAQALPGRQLRPYRQGVDEQADHGLHPGHGGRPAGDGGAEHHVLPARDPGQDDRPGALHQGAERDAQLGGDADQRTGGLRGQRDVGLPHPPRVGPHARVGHDQRRFLHPGQLGPPGPVGGRRVLLRQPAQEVAVPVGPRQDGGVAPGAVQPQQLAHQDAQRPAVQQGVVRGQHQLGLVRSGQREADPQQRGPGRVEVVGLVLGEQPPQGLGARGVVQLPQVGVEPGQFDLVEDQLREVAGAVGDEGGAQVGVPVEQRLPGRPHPLGLDGAGQAVDDLDVVGVVRGVREHRLEQQAVLERGERPHVRQGREACLPAFQFALAYGDQRHVGGGQPARARPGGVPGQTGEGGAPQVGQLTHLVAGEHAGREPEADGERRAVLGVRHRGVDLQGGHHGHVGVGDGDQLVHPRGL
uniref:hypothetical protein n=1 Tax=Streptomyces sp. MH60 TaxID=1940758 RepID=UPI001F546825